MTEERIISVAIICHQTNKAYCESIGERSQRDWQFAPGWQRDSAIAGVTARMENPDEPPSALHQRWLERKKAEGWTYAQQKDEKARTHPCMKPFNELSPEQQKKDVLFCAICKAMLA